MLYASAHWTYSRYGSLMNFGQLLWSWYGDDDEGDDEDDDDADGNDDGTGCACAHAPNRNCIIAHSPNCDVISNLCMQSKVIILNRLTILGQHIPFRTKRIDLSQTSPFLLVFNHLISHNRVHELIEQHLFICLFDRAKMIVRTVLFATLMYSSLTTNTMRIKPLAANATHLQSIRRAMEFCTSAKGIDLYRKSDEVFRIFSHTNSTLYFFFAKCSTLNFLKFYWHWTKYLAID